MAYRSRGGARVLQHDRFDALTIGVQHCFTWFGKPRWQTGHALKVRRTELAEYEALHPPPDRCYERLLAHVELDHGGPKEPVDRLREAARH